MKSSVIDLQQDLLKKLSLNLRFVLVEPTHPGNIGAVARAMKTMGLENLVLVNPEKFPHIEATKRAAGAESVLEQAEVVSSLSSAISDCDMVLGTSVRDREVAWSTITPRVAAAKVVTHHSTQQGNIALLFGRERSGLTNQELDLCQYQIRVPANEEYSSLNLGSAVQILAYEIRMSVLESQQLEMIEDEHQHQNKRKALARSEDLQGYYLHLEETLEQIGFIKNKPPTKLMRKIVRLYNRAQINVEEMQILRGILTAMQSFVQKTKDEK